MNTCLAVIYLMYMDCVSAAETPQVFSVTSEISVPVHANYCATKEMRILTRSSEMGVENTQRQDTGTIIRRDLFENR